MDKVFPLLTGLLFSYKTFSQNNSGSLVRQLLAANSNHSRIEFVFRLAETKKNDLSLTDQKSLQKLLLKWYRDEPDAGLHSAIDYLFRPYKKGDVPRTMNWNLAHELEKIDKQLQKKGNNGSGWFLTPQLQTMTIINGPVTYTMGSPPNEQYRADDEEQQQLTIPRSFAISTKEVTVAQFQEFLEDNPLIKQAARKDSSKFPSIENKRLLVFSPEPDCPQIYVTWYEAAQYCNWLSKKDRVPESEWCYPTNEMIKGGTEIPRNYLNRKGDSCWSGDQQRRHRGTPIDSTYSPLTAFYFSSLSLHSQLLIFPYETHCGHILFISLIF